MVSVWLLANGIPPLFCKVGSGNAAGLLPEVVDGRGEIARGHPFTTLALPMTE